MNTFKLYVRSMIMLLKCQLEYPLSFFLQTVVQFVMEGGEMLALVLLIDRFDRLGRWSAGDLYFFFGMMAVTFYLTECFGRGVTGAFPSLVRTGQLDTFLIRPRGILTQVLISAIDPRRIICIAIGIFALVIGCRMSEVQWTFLKGLAFAEAVSFGFLMILALFLIEAIFTIHSVKSVELVNAITYGGRSACAYPVTIYPKPLRALYTVAAPFALVLQAPSGYILDKPLYGWPEWCVFLSPLSGAVFFAGIYCLFRKALTFYRSTGS